MKELSGNERINLAVVVGLIAIAFGLLVIMGICYLRRGAIPSELNLTLGTIAGVLGGFLSRDLKHAASDSVTVNNTPDNPVQVEEKKPDV